MILVVHPGSRIRIMTFYPSRIQGSKRHRIPDPDPQQKIKIRIWDEHPRSYFREIGNFFWVKILKFFDADPGIFLTLDLGWTKY